MVGKLTKENKKQELVCTWARLGPLALRWQHGQTREDHQRQCLPHLLNALNIAPATAARIVYQFATLLTKPSLKIAKKNMTLEAKACKWGPHVFAALLARGRRSLDEVACSS